MDLKLSNRGDYVVRSAICLARAYRSGQPRKLRQVSAEMAVPRTFVSQILGDLVHADLAVSSFGKDGGYRLARPPGQVSLLQVIVAGEGSLVPTACPAAAEPCHWRELCPVYDSWAAAAGALRTVLASTSLASVAERDQVIDRGTAPIAVDPLGSHARAVAVADSVHVQVPASVVVTQLRAGGSWLLPHLQQAAAEEEQRCAGGIQQRGARLEAELRVLALDEERAELSISGRYCPPLGRAGQVLDEALLGRVARATVRAFLRRVARGLEQGNSATGRLAEDGHGEHRLGAEGA